MNTYTVYFSMLYDNEDPTPSRRLISVDVPESLLAFVMSLTNPGVTFAANQWEIESLAILPPGAVAQVAPHEHLESMAEFMNQFGSVHWKAPEPVT